MDRLRSAEHGIQTRYLCPCSVAAHDDAGAVLRRSHDAVRWPELFFCARCGSVRCRRCLQFEFTAKYCARCAAPARIEQSTCPRNCFRCPRCQSPLVVRADDKLDATGTLQGKVFTFTCPLGDYVYDTGVVEKPRPLSRILQAARAEQDPGAGLFRDLQRHYAVSRELLRFQEKQSTLRRSVRTSAARSPSKSVVAAPAHGISAVELARLSARDETPPFVLVDDVPPGDTSSTLGSAATAARTSISVEAAAAAPPPASIPVGEPLRAKATSRCKKCSHVVVRADPDVRSSKFQADKLGVDVLPQITATPLLGADLSETLKTQHISVLLHFANSTALDTRISVSTFDTLPLSADGSVHATVKLPCSEFALGGRPDASADARAQGVAATIPTVYLTDASAASRAALAERAAVLDRLKVPLLNNTSGKPLDSGANWCTVALNIALDGTGHADRSLEVPFFVSVAAEGLNYGFWVTVDVGTVRHGATA